MQKRKSVTKLLQIVLAQGQIIELLAISSHFENHYISHNARYHGDLTLVPTGRRGVSLATGHYRLVAREWCQVHALLFIHTHSPECQNMPQDTNSIELLNQIARVKAIVYVYQTLKNVKVQEWPKSQETRIIQTTLIIRLQHAFIVEYILEYTPMHVPGSYDTL